MQQAMQLHAQQQQQLQKQQQAQQVFTSKLNFLSLIKFLLRWQKCNLKWGVCTHFTLLLYHKR